MYIFNTFVSYLSYPSQFYSNGAIFPVFKDQPTMGEFRPVSTRSKKLPLWPPKQRR